MVLPLVAAPGTIALRDLLAALYSNLICKFVPYFVSFGQTFFGLLQFGWFEFGLVWLRLVGLSLVWTG